MNLLLKGLNDLHMQIVSKNLTLSYRFFRYMSVFWMGVIFFLSSRPQLPLENVFIYQDKLAHIVIFFILGYFYGRSFKRIRHYRQLHRIFIITAMVGIFGLSDEIHQIFVPGRTASLWDFSADLVGGLLASIFIRRGSIN